MLESDAEYISSQLFNLSQAESIVELYTREQAVHFVLREAEYATDLAVGVNHLSASAEPQSP